MPYPSGPSNFSNIKRMFTLNKDDAQQMGNNAYGQVQRDDQAAKSAINGVQTSSDYYNSNAQADKDFMGQKVDAAEKSQALMTSAGGRQQLLAKNVQGNASYGQGARGLDSALTAGSQSQAMTQQLGQQYGSLRQMMTQKQGQMDANNAQYMANKQTYADAQAAAAKQAQADAESRADAAKADSEFDAFLGKGDTGSQWAATVSPAYTAGKDVFDVSDPKVKHAMALIFHAEMNKKLNPKTVNAMQMAAMKGGRQGRDELIDAFRIAASELGGSVLNDLFGGGGAMDESNTSFSARGGSF